MRWTSCFQEITETSSADAFEITSNSTNRGKIVSPSRTYKKVFGDNERIIFSNSP